MGWPSLTDYQEAVQNPSLCFSTPELKNGIIQTDRFGLPKPVTGGFASVYQVKNRSSKYAIRCFIHNFPDQEARYSIISRYLEQANLPFMVDFVFLRQGILIKKQWYPILKMEWINGEPLSAYIINNLQSPQQIRKLADKFLAVLAALRAKKIAHGDLQHGNILIVNGTLMFLHVFLNFAPPKMKNIVIMSCGAWNGTYR